MNKSLILLPILISIACSQYQKSETSTDTTLLALPQNQVLEETTSTSNIEEDESCVFNTDYKGLTEEWLSEVKINDFIWDDKLKQAIIPRGLDTILISQGGCVHFGILAEIRLTNDNHTLDDSIFFIKKALELSSEFQLATYQKMIIAGRLKIAQESKETIWYVIDDDDVEDNLFYNGIEITIRGTTKRINLSQYYN